LLDALLLVVGLAALIKGADLLVVGASEIAARLGVSALVVGLTVVSFGTSMPELLVTMVSGLRQNADLAIANIIGSNIANVLLVLGVAAIIRPLPVQNSTVVSEIPFSLIAALLVGFLANAALLSDLHELSISRLDGVILLFFFVMFLLYVYKISRQADYFSENREVPGSHRLKPWAYIAAGIVALYFGGQWVVDAAVNLAASLGVDDALIGLTIVAIGTSSPELVASAMAAWRGQTDIAVGNVVGSNIFNLLWILGITATVVELPFEVVNNTDLLLVIGSSTIVILAMITSRRRAILRWHGGVFVALYAAYLTWVVLR
jgi:cation:H+ antiporter